MKKNIKENGRNGNNVAVKRQVEMDDELGRERCQRSGEQTSQARNYRNGYSKKTVKTRLGEVDIKVPRDRQGKYEPKIIGKYDRNAEGMEEKILALYTCGMSQQDISEQIKELYNVEISPELVSKISEKIMPEVTAWQNRPLEKVYPFVFMDAIHYKVKEDHRYITKAAYVVLGITMDGKKDILGVWIGEHESSKFWLNVLNDLKSRGVMDVYLFCTDGLCGMMQAIEAVFSNSRLQWCIVHQIRASTRYVSYKDIKQVVADLKKIYTAVTLDEAENNLLAFEERWRGKYPSCVKSWEDNWEVLTTFPERAPPGAGHHREHPQGRICQLPTRHEGRVAVWQSGNKHVSMAALPLISPPFAFWHKESEWSYSTSQML